jgi:hypothetical protein
LPPEPTGSQLPTPTITPTFSLINGDSIYTVVGLPLDQTLPQYHQPSQTAALSGTIPAGGSSIRTTGVEIQAESKIWLQVEYQGVGGWVDLSYLARQKGDIPEELIELAQQVAAALKVADYTSLATIVHPEDCLRFSPYPYLQGQNLTFCPEELAGLPGSNTVFNWGQFDGSGNPIELTFDEYHQRFVYDQDYHRPQVVGLNQEVSTGNAINNIAEVFPDGIFVEYHFGGFDPQYGGLDWRSLRMVFRENEGSWLLVALVHCEWTI